ncbi:BON domain-containing protein [Salipiger sp.]|uniref:BON domain-containing protein n=1 Tax=Salipiger sp. TaxID=2078585 RepID=UPI003A976C75
MSEPEKNEERTVFSERAEPDRPGGYHGVRQPMEPDAAVPVPGGEPATDAGLTHEVEQALAADGRLEGQRISIRVSGGVVEMDGAVALEFQRTLAAGIARSVPGVLSVQNRLAVGEQ